jgi:hypothetical protein
MKSAPYLDGWLAHKGGLNQHCPYREDVQPYSYGQWVSGWCDRFSAVKHETDLSLDDTQTFV